MRSGSTWVDPRDDPNPPATGLPHRVTEDPNDIAALVDLCKAGRVYSVERWIEAGKPLQATSNELGPGRYQKSPLAVAVESGQCDLALLLLCNGYLAELEPQSILDLALRRRAWDFVELLLAWGADPTEVGPETVLDTYQGSLMDQFWNLGVDFTQHHCLASYLSCSTRNKPAYGWARRNREDPRVAYELALGLGEAASEGSEKAVCLLLWAGADPRRRVPSLRWGSGDEDDPDEEQESAIEVAVQMGHGKLLHHLKPDPALDDFEELFGHVQDAATVRTLTALCPPSDWSRAIVRNIGRLSYWVLDRQATHECLRHIFEDQCGCLKTLDHEGCQDLRRSLLRLNDSELGLLLGFLARPQLCDPTIFAELTRTQAMRRRMVGLGLLSEEARRSKGR